MPNRNIYLDSFQSIQESSKHPLWKRAAIILGISLIISALLIFSLTQYAVGRRSVLGTGDDAISAVPTFNVYDEIVRGGVIFTGNALQFSNPLWKANNTGGAFMTNDSTLRFGNYPAGSTNDWQQNSSTAVLDYPANSEILHAELIWGGSWRFRDENVLQASKGPVTFATSQGSFQISPAVGRGGEILFATGNDTENNYYVRSQDVTSLVRASRQGSYTVSKVPATVDVNNNNYNNAGWTLAIVYGNVNENARKVSLNVVTQHVLSDANNIAGGSFRVDGFATPPTGPVRGKLFVNAQEGDSVLFGDEFRFAETEAGLANNSSLISGPNNFVNNFFGSQINNANGIVDRTGTQGNNNEPLQTSANQSVRGNTRHGWDITTIDVSDKIDNNQSTAFARGTSRGDGYVINAVAFQIDTNAPNPEVIIERDRDFVKVGQTIQYTITVNNDDGIIRADSVVLSSLVPEGTNYVPGSLTIDGQPATGNPLTGFRLDALEVGESAVIVYEVEVTSIPTSRVFENDAGVDFEYIPVAGAEPIQDQIFSNRVVTTVLDGPIAPPEAVNDNVTTKINTPVPIQILTNDTDPLIEETNKTATPENFERIVTQPTNGTIVVNEANGVVTYTPNTGYTGTDTFEYEICNFDGCDEALVTITISDLQPPIATDDTETGKTGEPIAIPILTNDTDPLDPNDVAQPDIFTEITTPPTNGTVVVDETTGIVTYTSNPTFNGTDTFEYEICNEDGCDEAIVTVTVAALQPPIANNDVATTQEGEPVLIGVLSNDTDPLDTNNAVQADDFERIVTQPTNGTVTVGTNGVHTYTPNNGFTGQDTYEYEICNIEGCDTALVTVTIEPKNPPIASNDSGTTKQNQPIDIQILTNDENPLNPNNVVQPGDFERIVTPPTNGTVTQNPNTGINTYTPNTGFTGTDTFVYEICNEDGCDEATVTIRVDPLQPPIANDDSTTTDEGTPVTIPILTNDTDPLDPNNVVQPDDFERIVTPPTNGTIIVNNNGTITYTPNPGFTGPTDSFVYEICNEEGCDQATVTITVDDLQPPVANNDTATTEQNQLVNLPIIANDTNPINPDGRARPQDFTRVITQPTNGSVTVNPTTSIATYTPNTDYFGTDSFVYEICNIDGCDTAIGTITIPAPRPPTANDDTRTTEVGTPVTIPVLDNDENPLNPGNTPDPDDVTRIVTPPQCGTAVINPITGTITYNTEECETPTDSFVYEICNADGCDTAVVTITLTEPDVPQVTPVTPTPTPTPTPQRPKPAVLGANERLPRTGGSLERIVDIMLSLIFIISGFFFASLYFIKQKKNI